MTLQLQQKKHLIGKTISQNFAEGGFDIVIGNPPYVAARNMNENERDYLSKKYKELRCLGPLRSLLLLEKISVNIIVLVDYP